MISTANLTVASSKAVASLATVHVPWPLVIFRPSAEDVTAFHRTQKNLWYPGSISTCVII